MKRYFIVLSVFVFVSAFSANESRFTGEEEKLNSKESSAFERDASPQKLSWYCQRDKEDLRYIVNNQPKGVDAEGRKLLCELYVIYRNPRKLYYAVHDRLFCNKKAQELIEKRALQGWDCFSFNL